MSAPPGRCAHEPARHRRRRLHRFQLRALVGARASGRHRRRVRRTHLRRQRVESRGRAARVRQGRHRRHRRRDEDAARLRDRHDRQLRGRVAQLVRDHEPGRVLPDERRRDAATVRSRAPGGRRDASTVSTTCRRARSTATSTSTRPSPSTSRLAYAPRTPYNASKAGGDHAVRAYSETFGLPISITNCANNYGPYQFPEKVIPLFVTRAIDDIEIPLYASTQNRREWIHADDHCRAIAMILDNGRTGETYHVGTGEERSIEEIADAVLAALGKPASLKKIVPGPARPRSSLPARSRQDHRRARLGAARRVQGRDCRRPSTGTPRIASGGSRSRTALRSTKTTSGSDLSVARPGDRRGRHGRSRGRRALRR